MKNLKRFLALGLALVLTVSSSVMVFAEDPEGESTTPATSMEGSGAVEGSVDTDVYSVVLPTEAESAASLDFILDPEGLIENTEGAAHTGETFEDGATLFFKNADGDTTWSSTSDELVFVNKSTYDVDVSVSAEVTGADGITMTEDKAFTDDTSASMYLALVDGEDAETAITSGAATAKVQVAKAPEGAYEYSWTEEDGYKYSLASDLTDITFAEAAFKLTGACNAAGSWGDLTAVAPKVTITWNIAEHKDNAAPAIATTDVTFSKASGATVSVDLGGGDLGATGIASIATIVSGKAYAWTAADYTLEGSTLKFPASASISGLAVGQVRTVKVTFNDTAATAVTLTVTVAE